MKSAVEAFQAFLLRSYDAVLFAEADEFVVADPLRYDGLGAYVEAVEGPAACCTGFNVVHYPADEAEALRLDRPLLDQRRFWRRSAKYSKRLLTKVPLAWTVGFHLEREGGGIGANERLWEIVDRVELGETTPLACMREVGAGLERLADGDDYMRTWGQAIGEWCRLFEGGS